MEEVSSSTGGLAGFYEARNRLSEAAGQNRFPAKHQNRFSEGGQPQLLFEDPACLSKIQNQLTEAQNRFCESIRVGVLGGRAGFNRTATGIEETCKERTDAHSLTSQGTGS